MPRLEKKVYKVSSITSVSDVPHLSLEKEAHKAKSDIDNFAVIGAGCASVVTFANKKYVRAEDTAFSISRMKTAHLQLMI